MLLGVFCFSQTVTKKYNSYYNRYDYFDSSSNLIGYEKYNSYSRQWEYYRVQQAPQRQPYEYKDPQQLDISNLGNAASTLQNRYNSNQKSVQTVVDDILYQIKSLNISDDRKNRIIDDFNKTVINNMETLYKGNVNWLYDAANTIIKNVKD